jgi:hypothetical protein
MQQQICKNLSKNTCLSLEGAAVCTLVLKKTKQKLKNYLEKLLCLHFCFYQGTYFVCTIPAGYIMYSDETCL